MTCAAGAAGNGHDRAARDRLLVSYLPLVRRVAARYRGIGLPYEDLVQEGSLGLLEAIAQYDETRGVAFEFPFHSLNRHARNPLLCPAATRVQQCDDPPNGIEQIDRATIRDVDAKTHP